MVRTAPTPSPSTMISLTMPAPSSGARKSPSTCQAALAGAGIRIALCTLTISRNPADEGPRQRTMHIPQPPADQLAHRHRLQARHWETRRVHVVLLHEVCELGPQEQGEVHARAGVAVRGPRLRADGREPGHHVATQADLAAVCKLPRR